MKVAFVSPFRLERDGVASYSRELCAELSKHSSLVHFPLDDRTHRASRFREMAEGVNRCDLMHVEHTHAFFKGFPYPFREHFLAFLKRVAVPRMVVYHEPLESIEVHRPPAGKGVARRWRASLLFAGMTLARPAANAWWLPAYNRAIFSIPERVVVHTEYRAGMVRRFAPGARVLVMPHPVYLPQDAETAPGALPVHPFREEDVVLTVFGFVDDRKDYLGVLEAMRELPQTVKLLVAGGCHDEGERIDRASPFGKMMAYARASGLEGRLHVTGYCPDEAIPRIMRATDIVIAPFKKGHSSGSINMGLAYSRPVVAYRTLLTEEMNRNGAGLILVDGKSWLAPALRKVLEDPAGVADAVARAGEYRTRFGFPSAALQLARWHAEMCRSG